MTGPKQPPHPSLSSLAHRPWPLPESPWRWRQSWLDLAFVHHAVDPAHMAPLLPKDLRLETFEGVAWLAVVPFRMHGVMRRPFPDMPGFSSFPEINLRTYVTDGVKSGVYFFSLDATNLAVVLGGRLVYGVPYHWAAIRKVRMDGRTHIRSVRGSAVFDATYGPKGPRLTVRPGSFEHWATERYALYGMRGSRLHRVQVHHEPWPLYEGDVQVTRNTLPGAAGIPILPAPPRTHWSPGVQVVSFAPEEPGSR